MIASAHPDIGYPPGRERRGRTLHQRLGHAVPVTGLVQMLAGHR